MLPYGHSLLPTGIILSGISVFAVCYFFYSWLKTRMMFRRLKHHGFPMMEHSIIFGHFRLLLALMRKLPPDAYENYLSVLLVENWRQLFPSCSGCPPLIYVDLWPFSNPLMFSVHPVASAQFTQTNSKPRPSHFKTMMYPLSGNRDLISTEGDEWKVWRRRLNPSFSIQNVTARVPDILDEVEDFVDLLENNAASNGQWGKTFQLEPLTMSLTIDVIFRFVLYVVFQPRQIQINEVYLKSLKWLTKQYRDSRLCELKAGPSAVAGALVNIVSHMFFYVGITNVIVYLNPLRWLRLFKDYRQLHSYIKPRILLQATEMQEKPDTANKSTIHHLYSSILKEEGSDDIIQMLSKDERFLESTIGHINTFLFAGHDTTSFTACWVFRDLARYPEVLAKVRAELDAVLGSDASRTSEVLRDSPSLVNSLVYTNAVIKESMRLNTNVGSLRKGEAGFFINVTSECSSEFEGKQFPTEGFLLFDGTFGMHRLGTVWHRPTEFLPERYLIKDANDPLYPPKNGWRAFEAGPRNCIGQNLAVVELKLVIALTVRKLDIECDYEGWDALLGRTVEPKPTAWGDRCYQVGNGSHMPPRVKDKMPVRVRMRQ